MAIKRRKKGDTGKRYSDNQKQKIMKFVEKQGHGGISAATEKYGVSYIALKRWMNGTAGQGKVGRPRKVKLVEGRNLVNVRSAIGALRDLKKQLTLVQRALSHLAK